MPLVFYQCGHVHSLTKGKNENVILFISFFYQRLVYEQ